MTRSVIDPSAVDGAETASPASPGAEHSKSMASRVIILCSILVGSSVLAIGLGSAVVAPDDTIRYLWAAITGGTIRADEVTDYQIIWQLRTPRVLLAAVVGAGLTVVGVAIQALVRNALADPFVLGVSSSASVGAVVVGLFGALTAFGIYAVSTGAFIGAVLGASIVYLASYARAGLTPLRLVLTGVAMSFGFQAIMSVLVYFAPDGEAASTVLFWTMGGFGAATWGSLPIVAGAVAIGIAILWRQSRGLDVMALGDETSTSLGVDSMRLRRWLFGLVSVVTGAMVAVSGAIGFVGLVMPHLVRIWVGASHRRVLAIAPFLGGIFMVWVDLAARTIVAPRELPIGTITALVGVPVFITLMRRKGYLFGGR